MHIPVRRFLHPPFNLWIPVPQHFFMKLLSLSCFQDALERLIKNGLIKKISPPTKAIHLFFNQWKHSKSVKVVTNILIQSLHWQSSRNLQGAQIIPHQKEKKRACWNCCHCQHKMLGMRCISQNSGWHLLELRRLKRN